MAAKEGMTTALALLLILCQGAVFAFRQPVLEVPPHAKRYTNQTLTCKYSLAPNEELYVLKWFHNEDEIFRYTPVKEQDTQEEKSPEFMAVKSKNVEVIVEESNTEKIVLKEVDLSASGEYKCAVSLDWPEFREVTVASNMSVVVIPLEQPNIEGDVDGQYSVGDRVRLNCTAAPSTPPASLVWLINDKKAPNEYLIHYEHSKAEEDGLYISSLGLNFKLSKADFIKGELKLKCTATISTLYHRSDEHSQQHPTEPIEEEYGLEHLPSEGLVTTAGTSGGDVVWTFPIQRLLGLHALGFLLSVHFLL